MRAKQIFEFTRGGDPLDTLGIGYKGKIHKFFDDLGVDRDDYNIKDKQIKFTSILNLENKTNLIELPDNLIVISSLNLKNCIKLIKLPNNLFILNYLSIQYCTKIVELPDDLDVGYKIFVNSYQTELIEWIKTSKFYNKLILE